MPGAFASRLRPSSCSACSGEPDDTESVSTSQDSVGSSASRRSHRFLGVRGRGHLLTYVRLPFGPISLALMKRSSSFVRVTLDISSAFCSNACSVEVDAAKNRDDSVRSTPDRAPLHVRLEVFERVRLMFDMMKPPEKLYDEFADKCRVFNAKRPVEQQLNDASFIAETATC